MTARTTEPSKAMSSTAGLDIQRGRPLPAIGTTEAKLQQRKLDALKRGVHRIKDASTLVYGIHLVGVGGAGAKIIERFLRDAPPDLLNVPGSRLSALVVDIGDDDLHGVREQAKRFDTGQAHIETVSLPMVSRGTLDDTLARYVDFLKLEYPLYHPNPSSGQWLPDIPVQLAEDGTVPRAIAKAIYGRSYYDGDRPMLHALKRFARSVEATQGDSLVCMVFGLGGGTGSGIAVDLARHLSQGLFGRRVLVAGIGILPHEQELDAKAAALHTAMCELDVLCDETKNSGVTQSCGEQYRNPFTAGFVVVPQPPGASVAGTRDIIDGQVTSLFLQRRGANLWEALRLLNWVAAPSTQHSAARTPWGARWIHAFGFGHDRRSPAGVDVRSALGLQQGYSPEFIELRTSGTSADESVALGWATTLNEALTPELATQPVTGGPDGCVQFLLPRMARSDLLMTQKALAAYRELPMPQRHAHHSLLLEQGVLLCEPSTRLQGMAGASLGSGHQWVAVPLDQLNGLYE